jgi:hypothetical protein
MVKSHRLPCYSINSRSASRKAMGEDARGKGARREPPLWEWKEEATHSAARGLERGGDRERNPLQRQIRRMIYVMNFLILLIVAGFIVFGSFAHERYTGVRINGEIATISACRSLQSLTCSASLRTQLCA